METRPALVNIFGPMTAGKSTLAALLAEHLGYVYTVDYDVVKHQIFDYVANRDRAVSAELTYSLLSAVAATDFPIIALIPPPKTVELSGRVADIARKHQRNLLNVEVRAPVAVLLERYERRMLSMREENPSVRLKTPEEFEAAVRAPYVVPAGTLVLDSSVFTPEQMLEQVLPLLGR